MTVVRLPALSPDGVTSGHDDPTDSAERVRMRAHCRHQATVVTIIGDIDLSNTDHVHDFVTRFLLAGNALILDLSDVDFFAARGVSVLIAIDDACRTAEVPWVLVPSRIVSRVLQLTECDTAVPTARSVPEALGQLSTLTARRRLAQVTTTSQRHAM